MSEIRFTSFPRTQPPPEFVAAVVGVFQRSSHQIDTEVLKKGLTSDGVLSVLREGLNGLGFEVEAGKKQGQKIKRPVYFGENGAPALQYEIDAFHPGWRCGLEIEAGRAWMGNAVYRDLIQALIMVNLDHLILAVTGFKAAFIGEVVEPALPRKVKQIVPEPSSQRRPPYDLHYIREDKWKSPTCWGEREWNGTDAGCFHEPSQTKALALIINEDMELLRQYRESLIPASWPI